MSGRVLSAKEIAEILTPQRGGRFGLIQDERVNLVATFAAYQVVVVAARRLAVDYLENADLSAELADAIVDALADIPEEYEPR